MNSHNKISTPAERDRNPAEYLILGVLSTGQQHGYDLYQYLEENLGRIWTLGRSQTYALLSRMEQAGLVTHKRQAQERRPDRKTFTFTPAGKKIFNHWVKAPLVYATDALTRARDLKKVLPAPEGSHPPVVYPITAVKGTKNEGLARAFIAWVISSEGKNILERYGFKTLAEKK